MGAAHSSEPRSVSMDNPTPGGVIDISDDVVKRLKQGISRQTKENSKTEASSTKVDSPPKLVPAVPKADVAAPIKQSTIVNQNRPSVMYAAPSGYTLSSIDVLRQKEIELKENDDLWRQRMEQLEQTLKKTNTIMETEYSSAVEDVRTRFTTASTINQLPPCQELKAQVVACYHAYPGETLKCAEEVAAFRNCVNLNRIKKLDVAESSQETYVASKPPKAA